MLGWILVATTAMVENPTDAGNRETKIAERKIIRRGGDREETRRNKRGCRGICIVRSGGIARIDPTNGANNRTVTVRGRRIGACGIALRPRSPHGQQG